MSGRRSWASGVFRQVIFMRQREHETPVSFRKSQQFKIEKQKTLQGRKFHTICSFRTIDWLLIWSNTLCYQPTKLIDLIGVSLILLVNLFINESMKL